MKFTSKKYKTARYVVEPRDRFQQPGHPVQKIVGLAAEFKNHVWDSEQAAKTLKWTDDQRMLVEATLLTHEDFGRRFSKILPSIWLVPSPTPDSSAPVIDVNRDIPDELEAFQPGLREQVANVLGLSIDAPEQLPKCAHILVDEDGPRQCRRDAKVGAYCTGHAKQHDPSTAAGDLASQIEAEALTTA